MTTGSRIPAPPLAQGLTPRLPGLLARAGRGALRTLARWHELSRQRRALLELDERLLRDIGLTRADLLQEASRPFWDDPLR